MRCENCGAELASGSRFCTSCGKEAAPYTAQEVITADQPRADYSQQYNYVPPQQQIILSLPWIHLYQWANTSACFYC